MEVAMALYFGDAFFNDQTLTSLEVTDVLEDRIASEDVAAQQKFFRPAIILEVTGQLLEGIRLDVGVQGKWSRCLKIYGVASNVIDERHTVGLGLDNQRKTGSLIGEKVVKFLPNFFG